MRSRYIQAIQAALALLTAGMLVLPIFLDVFQLPFFSKSRALALVFIIFLITACIYLLIRQVWQLHGGKKYFILIVLAGMITLLQILWFQVPDWNAVPTIWLEEHALQVNILPAKPDEAGRMKFKGLLTGETWVDKNTIRFSGSWQPDGMDLIGRLDTQLEIDWQGIVPEHTILFLQPLQGSGVIRVTWDDGAAREFDFTPDGQVIEIQQVLPLSSRMQTLRDAFNVGFFFGLSFTTLLLLSIVFHGIRKVNSQHTAASDIHFIAGVMLLYLAVSTLFSGTRWGLRDNAFEKWQADYIDPLQTAASQLRADNKILIGEPRFAYYLRDQAPVLLMFSQPTWGFISAEDTASVSREISAQKVGAVMILEETIPMMWEGTAFYRYLQNPDYAEKVYSSPPNVKYMRFVIYSLNR